MKIVLEKGQNLYFTSDTHYGHSNICRATTNWTDADSVTRDFKSLDHMNDVIVDNINSIVGENDVLIHLGDWSFGGFDNIAEFRSRIVCKNVHLTYGNHDHHIRSWDSMNANMMHLHGHTHLPKHLRIAAGRAMDVGTDGNDLQPISLDEVVSLLKNQPIKKLCLPKDHHEKRLL